MIGDVDIDEASDERERRARREEPWDRAEGKMTLDIKKITEWSKTGKRMDSIW